MNAVLNRLATQKTFRLFINVETKELGKHGMLLAGAWTNKRKMLKKFNELKAQIPNLDWVED